MNGKNNSKLNGTMNNLQTYIDSHDLTSKGVKIHIFKESSTHTAEAAAEVLNCKLSQIVKSIIIIVETEEKDIPMLIIVPGTKKLRHRAIRKLLRDQLQIFAKDSRLATKEEVFTLTGYNVGGVPPISLNLSILSDTSIKNEDVVFGGGGQSNTIVEIPTKVFFQLTQPIFGEFCANI